MKNLLNILGKLAVIFIFSLAVYLLYHKLKAYSFNEIKIAVNAISPKALIFSFCLMVMNFIVLMGYDWLALKAIKKKLRLVRVALVSFVGAVISLNFGALLGGSTVRYRLYSAWGFSPIEIIRLVLMLAVTFWVGAMGLAGFLFIFVPLELPEELGINLVSVKPLGFFLFGLCNSRNIVMAGATGCGKTEIRRTLSKKFNFIRIVNGPQLTCDGWKGSYHIKDIFTGETKETAGCLVIVIDEADKLFEPSIGSGGTDFGQKIQNELLKIMDGDALAFVDEGDRNKKITVDCSGISIVLCGSFERMLQERTEASGGIGFCQPEREESRIAECSEEDLTQYGNVRREIAGRINQIVALNTLGAEDFEAIMESPASPIQKIEQSHHVSLTVDKDTKRKLASDAEKSGLGCRYIRSRLQSMLDEQMFDEPDAKEYSLCYE